MNKIFVNIFFSKVDRCFTYIHPWERMEGGPPSQQRETLPAMPEEGDPLSQPMSQREWLNLAKNNEMQVFMDA